MNKEIIDYRGHKIHIIRDDDPQNPRKEFDGCIGKMVCYHSKYRLGDEHNWSDEQEFLDFIRLAIKNNKVVALNLYLYDHGSISISSQRFNCNRDRLNVGIIYTDLETIQQAGHDWKRWTKIRLQQAQQWLLQEVEVYDEYLVGNVYGYGITAPDGKELHHCWGYYGSDHEENGILSEARHLIDYAVEEANKQRFKQIKRLIRSRVPYQYRAEQLTASVA